MYKNKIVISVLALALLAAGCGPFGKQSSLAGVAKTENGGADWIFSNQLAGDPTNKKEKNKNPGSISNQDVSVLAFEPGKREHIYAASIISGVYESQDSAVTWKKILSKIAVYDLAIDQNNTQSIYAAGSSGGLGKVIKTKDGGKSWEEVYSEASPANTVRTIALNPNNTTEVIIGLETGNIVKSTDSGESWTLVANFNNRVARIRWQHNNIYALIRTRGLMRSSDGGVSFQEMTGPLKNSETFRVKQGSSTSPVTNSSTTTNPRSAVTNFSQMAVSQTNSQVIFVTADTGLFKTTDEGKTWSFVKLPLKNNGVAIRAVALGPTDNIVFATSGATIYKSLNGGESWQVQTVATNGLINYILVDPEVPQVSYAGIFGNN